MASLAQARSLIREVPDFPQPGIVFKDITPVLVDAVHPGEKVAIVDDLLATGGTAWGAAQLVQKQQGEVGAFLFVVELTLLKGRERIAGAGPVESLIVF